MYIDEKKPLKTVMDTMFYLYGFKASLVFFQACYIMANSLHRMRMYKGRIAKWGLNKNNKKHEVEAILRMQTQRSAVGKKSTFKLRGRSVDFESVRRYQRRKGLTTRDIMMPSISHAATLSSLRCTTPQIEDQTDTSEKVAALPTLRCNTPELQDESPIWTHSMLPTTTSGVEEILIAIRTYNIGSFETGVWAFDERHPHCRDVRNVCSGRNPDSKSGSTDLYVLISQSRELFKGGDYHHGGLCLRQGFSRIQEILREEDPFAVWELMNTVSFLHEQGWADVLQSVLCHLAQMSDLLKTPSHPLSRIFRWCCNLASSDLLEVIARMRQCAADQFEDVTGSLSVSTVKLRLGWLRALGLVSGHEAHEAGLRALLVRCRTQFGLGQVQCLLILNRLANSLYERGQYTETASIGHEILQHASSPHFKGCASVFKGRGLSLICRAQVAQGEYVKAEAILNQLLDLNIACYGWRDPLTMDAMIVLEMCLDKLGKNQDAARLRAQRLCQISEAETTA